VCSRTLADPYKVIRTGPSLPISGDPLRAVEAELAPYRYIALPALPRFTGGAMGYIAYDCVAHFEPRTARPLSDPLGIPEAVFLLCDSLVVFDHMYQTLKVVSHVHVPDGSLPAERAEAEKHIASLYEAAGRKVAAMVAELSRPDTPVPRQMRVSPGAEAVSNVGREGYKSFVRSLRKHIVAGDIIQAVPSQRLARPTDVHPFNIYRTLRTVNPSPYMFYLDVGDARIVGASPETLCKVEKGKVAVHAIAGTVKRGGTDEGEWCCFTCARFAADSGMRRGRGAGRLAACVDKRPRRACHAGRSRA
jgi:anthranilate synthase component 1